MKTNEIVKLLEGYEMPCGSGEYDFIHRKDYKAIAKELQQAMNYIPCCTQLLCLVDDFSFLTKNKTYEMVSEPDGHYVVIDDFGEERLLWKKYFKILN